MLTDKERLSKLESTLNSLLEDSRIGDSLGGSFPVTETSMGLRRVDGSCCYIPASYALPTTGWNTGNFTADFLRVYPFYVSTPANVNRLSFHISIVASGGSGRMGVYNSDRNMYPAELIVDAGQISITTTGWRHISFSKVKLSRGLKWIALNLQYMPQLTQLPNNTVWTPLGRTATAAIQTGWGVNCSYGVLPGKYPEGGTYRTGTPLMLVRLVE